MSGQECGRTGEPAPGPGVSADEALADRLAPLLAARLLAQPAIWGDPARLQVGAGVSLVNVLVNVASGRVVIEDGAFMGHNVCLLTGTHDVTQFGRARQLAVPEHGRDITIRRGAWIASNATVLGPCVVGENAVVSAGSLVVRDVPAGWIVAGSPARRIRAVTPHYANPQPRGWVWRLIDRLRRGGAAAG